MATGVLEMKQLGLTVRFLRTGAETAGEVLEMEVTGRPRGFLAQSHVHGAQAERLEVVSGAMKIEMGGREHVLIAGQSIEVPAGTPHTQVPVGDGAGVVRIEVRPAGRTQAFLERLAELCREGKITRMGFPRPVAGAELVLEYGDTGHAAKPSLQVQRAIDGLSRTHSIPPPPPVVPAALPGRHRRRRHRHRHRRRRSRGRRWAWSGPDADHVAEHVMDRDRAGAVPEWLDRGDERFANALLAGDAARSSTPGGREQSRAARARCRRP